VLCKCDLRITNPIDIKIVICWMAGVPVNHWGECAMRYNRDTDQFEYDRSLPAPSEQQYF